MSSTLFTALLLGHVILALIWLVTLLAALPMTLKLYGTSGGATTFKRAAMLRGVIAGSGGAALVLGIILIYYVEAVAKSYAPSAVGTPFVAVGALLGAVAFGLSTSQSRSLRVAFKAKMVQKSAMPSTGASQVSTSALKLPPRGLIISTPVILVIALLLMIAGSMM